MKKTCLVLLGLCFTVSLVSHAADVLLIPESTNDTVGMYDMYDGTYLGDLITGHPTFSTPINAIQGPDGNIYVSEQLNDAVLVFDTAGAFLEVYADATDGLNNIRGIDFYQGNLYVTSGDDYVAEFSAPHTREADFINDGSDPFDIYFLDDGTALVADIQGSTDNIRLYDATGTLDYEIFSVSFPEQIQKLPSGNYINAGFSANLISTFNLTSTISQISFSSGRGVFELGNGNLIATSGSGVHEVDSLTGTILTTLNAGVSARYIEVADIPGAEPTATPLPNCIHHGDVNFDGVNTAGDAQMAFQIALGTITPTYEEGCAADCNGDDTVTAGDAQQIFLVVLGSESCVHPL